MLTSLDKNYIKITIATQTLEFIDINKNKVIANYKISTASNGVGQTKNSFATPLGWHYIKAKIGKGEPINRVFIARRPQNKIFNPKIDSLKKDWILTRILWLRGLEKGLNLIDGALEQPMQCDSFHRFIYIHGTPNQNEMGKPLSKGCIRMHNKDVINLFAKANYGTKVLIIK